MLFILEIWKPVPLEVRFWNTDMLEDIGIYKKEGEFRKFHDVLHWYL